MSSLVTGALAAVNPELEQVRRAGVDREVAELAFLGLLSPRSISVTALRQRSGCRKRMSCGFAVETASCCGAP